MLASKVKMSVVLFPQLLGEYDSLIKDHEGLKVMILSLKFTLKKLLWLFDLFGLMEFLIFYLQNNLVSAENKLVDSNDQISELKRWVKRVTICELDLKVKKSRLPACLKVTLSQGQNVTVLLVSGLSVFHCHLLVWAFLWKGCSGGWYSAGRRRKEY